jgi:uncharacterized protein
MDNHPMRSRRAFHVMAKPIGPACNLECAYCFYLGKDALYPGRHSFRMSDAVLESFVRQYIAAQQVPEVTFAWQGGEPTLMGLDFFRRAVTLQKQYLPPGKRLINALQTNGTLLDDAWCEFLRENRFLVGISLDGPRELHDRYRVDKRQRPTFGAVMRGLGLLQQHGVEYNVLCVVNRENSRRPTDVYRFFKERGAGFLQFIPLVERVSSQGREVSAASVAPAEYGRFLCAIYDEWVRRDVGKIYVQGFEAAFSARLGAGAGLCVFEPACGSGLALEHNGDVYSCDHYVFPEYKLGNLCEQPLATLVDSAFQRKFGADKQATLPVICRECSVLHLCNGECPKNRFLLAPGGEEGLNYLCAGLKRFFEHTTPTMEWMAREFRQGRPPSGIMRALRSSGVAALSRPAPPPAPDATQPPRRGRAPGRNDSCPCGSGRKFKRCCGSG